MVSFSFEDCIVRFISCDLKHNHPIGIPTKKRTRNNLTLLQREKIATATKQGNSAHSIRLNQKLTCTKDVLYAARRPILQEMRNKEMEDLISEIKSWDNWSSEILKNEDNILVGCHIIHNVICSQSYAQDVCVVDDTSCTNKYNMPVLAMIVEDQNGRNQVLAFCVMESRQEFVFDRFFNRVKESVGQIRLFICDRNRTQKNSLLRIWPNCKIIYCSVHIGRNLRNSVSIEIFNLYQKMRKLLITEDDFLDACREFINAYPNAKGSKTLNNLLCETDNWLPSKIINYTHCDNETSNRVEGFFGSLKNILEHRIVTLAELIRAICIRGDRLYLTSINEPSMNVPNDLISTEDSRLIGSLALNIIHSEYNDLSCNGCLEKEYSRDCCKTHLIFGLPCKHLLLQRIKNDAVPLLSIEDIPKRWKYLHNTQIVSQKNPITTIIREDAPIDYSYSGCIARFEKYFSSAHRSQEIRDALDKCILQLSTVEHQSGTNEELKPPPCLNISGRPFSHPRNNSEIASRSGAPKRKRKYHCSICGSSDHTAPRCPKSLNHA